MSFGRNAVFTVTMASGGTLTPAMNFGGAWSTMYLEVPSMVSNSQINIQVASTLNGTYRRVRHPAVNTSSVQTNTYNIASSITNAIVPIPGGHAFMKIETTATCDAGETFKVLCSD